MKFKIYLIIVKRNLMQMITVTEGHRPARIGFIIPKGEEIALEKAIRFNTALWGGEFNPIIPYESDRHEEAEQLIRFFDPDFVHCIGSIPQDWIPENLKEEFHRGRQGPVLELHLGDSGEKEGFSPYDVQDLIYSLSKEYPAERNESRPIIPKLSDESPYYLFYLSHFGSYPENFEKTNYLELYRSQMNPEEIKLENDSPVIQEKIYARDSPISLTTSKLHWRFLGGLSQRTYIFVGDPRELKDIVSFWDLRATGNRVFFLPVTHKEKYKEFITRVYEEYAEDGVLDRLYLVFPNEIKPTLKDEVLDWVRGLTPKAVPYHRVLSPLSWNKGNIPRNVYSYEEEYSSIVPFVNGGIEFQCSRPPFVREHRGKLGRPFWFMDLSFRGLYLQNEYLTRFPKDLGVERSMSIWFTRRSRISDKGLSVPRGPVLSSIMMSLPRGFDVIESIFQHRGMSIELSQAGRIEQQIIKGLGGHIDNCRIFKLKAVRDVLNLLNDGKPHNGEIIRKLMGEALPDTPKDLSIIRGKRTSEFTPAEVLSLMHSLGILHQGWMLKCQTCNKEDWHPVSSVGEKFTCPWCFTEQKTPLLKEPDCYRTNGLYLIPRKMQGSIPVIVTLWRFLFGNVGPSDAAVFTPSVNIKDIQSPEDITAELDFICLQETGGWGDTSGFEMIIGEVKGEFDYKEEEIDKKLRVIERFELEFKRNHLFLCFSTLRDGFTENEKRLLKNLVEDGYEIIVLTRHELEPYSLYERFDGLRNKYATTLRELAENTQILNL